MAALLSAQYTPPLWQDGNCECFMLFSVRNVNTGDTVDLGSYMRVIEQCVWMGATVSGIAVGAFTGTVVTAPAGLTSAGAYLLAQGVLV
jgi:hypothetical protein